MTDREISRVFEALSDMTRLRLLTIIAYEKAMPLVALASVVGATKNNAIYHMKILETANVVKKHHSGKYVFFELNREVLKKVQDVLEFKKEVEV